MTSLRSYIVTMVSLLVLLLCASMALILRQVDAYARAQAERQLLDTARATSLAIDGQMRSYEALLLGLRQSEALQREDWAAFDAQARRVTAGSGAWIVVDDPTGRQRVNTRLPPGAALHHGLPPEEEWRTLRQGRTHYCNLTRGQIVPDILCVDIPVVRNGQVAYALTLVFQPALLDRTFAVDSQPGRLVTVLDRSDLVIWRNHDLQRFLGRHATPDMSRDLAQRSEGAKRSVSLEGAPTLIAFSRSRTSGWTSVVGLPMSEVGVLREDALGYGLLGGAVFLLIGAAVGLVAGRRVNSAVARLGAAAARLRRGEAPDFQASGLSEVDAVGAALDEALRERAASQERFRLAQEVGGIGAYEWDLVNDVGRVSDSYKEMYGLGDTVGPLRFAQIAAVIHPEDLPQFRARAAAARWSAEPSSNEYRVVHPDGSIRWIYARGRPLLSPQGRPVTAIGVVVDLTDRKQTEERLRLLMREVDHRANNLMAVMQGAVKLSRGRDAEDLRRVVLGRLQALARAHQLLSESRWRGADLRRLVEEELRPYALGDEARVRIEGGPAPLSSAAAQGVAMAVHELATNAAKHGALSVDGGRVDISWEIADERLRIRWAESGGPPVCKPSRSGIGTTVLQRALGGVIGGSVRLDWREEGLVCEMELPAAPVAE